MKKIDTLQTSFNNRSSMDNELWEYDYFNNIGYKEKD